MTKFKSILEEHNKHLDTGVSDAELMKSIKSIYGRVILLCEEKPSCKGSYNLLTTYYYWKYHLRKFGIPFNDLLNLPSPESITRAFRKAIENGEIEPTEKNLIRRQRREAIKNGIHKLGN